MISANWELPGAAMWSAFLAGLASAMAWCAGAAPIVAGEDMRATVDKPALVTITQPERSVGSGSPERLVLSVTGFQPSPNGPVEAVVTIRCNSDDREIGRFGIFPHTAFAAGKASQIQRFGFSLPDKSDCERPTQAKVHLVPSVGDGKAASMIIGGATYE